MSDGRSSCSGLAYGPLDPKEVTLEEAEGDWQKQTMCWLRIGTQWGW